MRDSRYELESLSSVFEGHARAQLKMHSELIVKYREEYPNDELPDHFKDDFCLPMALKVLVDEVIRLRRELQDACIRNFLLSTGSSVDESVADDIPTEVK